MNMHQFLRMRRAIHEMFRLWSVPMRVLPGLLLLVVLWPLAAAGEEQTAATQQPPLNVALEGEYLTVEAVNVPHRQIMEKVAEALQLKMVINSPFDEPRTFSFEHVPWQQGLEKALAPANWVIVYDRSSQPWRVAKVIVLGSGGKPASGGSRINSQARLPAAATQQTKPAGHSQSPTGPATDEEVTALFEATADMSVEEIEQFTTTFLGLAPGELNLREMLQELQLEDFKQEDLEALGIK